MSWAFLPSIDPFGLVGLSIAVSATTAFKADAAVLSLLPASLMAQLHVIMRLIGVPFVYQGWETVIFGNKDNNSQR
jgi:hypothetical protein